LINAVKVRVVLAEGYRTAHEELRQPWLGTRRDLEIALEKIEGKIETLTEEDLREAS
jgi:hypothetical protein